MIAVLIVAAVGMLIPAAALWAADQAPASAPA
jgi:hypothetical protein